MKSSTAFTLGAMLAVASAQPHHVHQHKRDMVVVTDVYYETVDVYTTVWLPPGGAPAPAATPSISPNQQNAIQPAPLAQQQQKQADQPVYKPSTPASSSSIAPPPPPPPPSSTPAPPPPVQQAPAPPPFSSTPAPPPPVQQAPAPPPPVQQAPASGGSSSNGQTHSGDATVFGGGGGACGWANDTNTEDFVALAAGFMGAYSNDSPGIHKNAFCGRELTITAANGKTASAHVTDKCPTCGGLGDLDMSQHLFTQLFPDELPKSGRKINTEWSFSGPPIFSGPP